MSASRPSSYQAIIRWAAVVMLPLLIAAALTAVPVTFAAQPAAAAGCTSMTSTDPSIDLCDWDNASAGSIAPKTVDRDAGSCEDFNKEKKPELGKATVSWKPVRGASGVISISITKVKIKLTRPTWAYEGSEKAQVDEVMALVLKHELGHANLAQNFITAWNAEGFKEKAAVKAFRRDLKAIMGAYDSKTDHHLTQEILGGDPTTLPIECSPPCPDPASGASGFAAAAEDECPPPPPPPDCIDVNYDTQVGPDGPMGSGPDCVEPDPEQRYVVIPCGQQEGPIGEPPPPGGCSDSPTNHGGLDAFFGHYCHGGAATSENLQAVIDSFKLDGAGFIAQWVEVYACP